MTWLDNRKKEFLFIGVIMTICIIAIIWGIFLLVRSGDVNLDFYKEGNWIEYTNEEYGFRMQYPPSWAVKEGFVVSDPVISFYPKTERLEPPYSHHSEATHVSVYPQGVATEGVFGQFNESKINDLQTKKEFYLSDGSVWALMVNFDDSIEDKENWKAWGFIWGGQKVQNIEYSCLKGGSIDAPIDNCDPFTGDEIVRVGEINQDLKNTIDRVMASFEFVE